MLSIIKRLFFFAFAAALLYLCLDISFSCSCNSYKIQAKIKDAKVGQEIAETNQKEVGNALAKADYIAAKQAVDKAEDGAKKSEEAVAAIGVGNNVNHPATKAALAARKAANEAKNAYDLVKEAGAGQGIAETNQQAVVNALAKADYLAAKQAVDKAEDGAKKSKAAVPAIGIGNNVNHPATKAALAARKAANEAEKAYNQAKRLKRS